MRPPLFGFQLRQLSFFGPNKEAASVKFGPGLNVLYGASDTGKSFVVETIDFMLGGKPPLRLLTELIGYDRIQLVIEASDGQCFTIHRSVEGGNFRLYDGSHDTPPATEVTGKILSEKHNEKNEENLSAFLLKLCELANKRVRKNNRGETNSLSFRNVARLLIVTEDEIIQRRSPLVGENVTAATSNISTFKLLTTGVDDTALVSTKSSEPEELSKDAQLQLLDQLLDDYKDRLAEIAKHPRELEEQLQKIDASINQHRDQLGTTEAEFQATAKRRRDLRQKLEEERDRQNEVKALLERFFLLDQHYASDIERLKGIEEGGTLFEILGTNNCPLCGADPIHQNGDSSCDGNVEAVVVAARSEISKIEILRSELSSTTSDLTKEKNSFDRRLPSITQELESLSSSVDRLIAPKLSKLRASYSEFADKRGEIREALSLYATVQDIERRRAELESKLDDGDKQLSGAINDIATSVMNEFCEHVRLILSEWHFPENGSIYFDSKAKDLVIAGKPRGARGKGLRAITHAAFTLGLLSFCRDNGTPHPGFAIIDSPLLAYREPDGTEDDLRGTDLQEKFYSYLLALPVDRQVIVVENTDPPNSVQGLDFVHKFSKNPHIGRYGLLPYVVPVDNSELDMPPQRDLTNDEPPLA